MGEFHTVTEAAMRVVEERTEATAVPRLWSVKAIAQRWNISRMQVYRAHYRGRLPGYRVLGTLRFMESDLLRLLREEGVPAGGAPNLGDRDER